MKAAQRLIGILFALLFVASVAVVIPACNTVKGAGEDIESVGEAGDEVI